MVRIIPFLLAVSLVFSAGGYSTLQNVNTQTSTVQTDYPDVLFIPMFFKT